MIQSILMYKSNETFYKGRMLRTEYPINVQIKIIFDRETIGLTDSKM